MKSLNNKNATRPDCIYVKFMKISVNAIDSHLANIVRKGLSKSKQSENSKTATARTIFETEVPTKTKSCRPVSLLNIKHKVEKQEQKQVKISKTFSK